MVEFSTFSKAEEVECCIKDEGKCAWEKPERWLVYRIIRDNRIGNVSESDEQICSNTHCVKDLKIISDWTNNSFFALYHKLIFWTKLALQQLNI